MGSLVPNQTGCYTLAVAAGEWDPGQYRRFAAERRQPFDELLHLLRPAPGGRLLDLGCGDGSLTAELHHALGVAEAVGLDSSPAMLAATSPADGLRFVEGDLATWDGDGASWDVITALADGGQLAVQGPANRDHPSHTVLEEAATDLGIELPPDHLLGVLAPERYAEILDGLGFREQHVRLQVFGHHLASTAEVVEWTKGTAQVRVRRATDAETYGRFVDEYHRRLLDVLGDAEPYFYAFKRILLWARR